MSCPALPSLGDSPCSFKQAGDIIVPGESWLVQSPTPQEETGDSAGGATVVVIAKRVSADLGGALLVFRPLKPAEKAPTQHEQGIPSPEYRSDAGAAAIETCMRRMHRVRMKLSLFEPDINQAGVASATRCKLCEAPSSRRCEKVGKQTRYSLMTALLFAAHRFRML